MDPLLEVPSKVPLEDQLVDIDDEEEAVEVEPLAEILRGSGLDSWWRSVGATVLGLVRVVGKPVGGNEACGIVSSPLGLVVCMGDLTGIGIPVVSCGDGSPGCPARRWELVTRPAWVVLVPAWVVTAPPSGAINTGATPAG